MRLVYPRLGPLDTRRKLHTEAVEGHDGKKG